MEHLHTADCNSRLRCNQGETVLLLFQHCRADCCTYNRRRRWLLRCRRAQAPPCARCAAAASTAALLAASSQPSRVHAVGGARCTPTCAAYNAVCKSSSVSLQQPAIAQLLAQPQPTPPSTAGPPMTAVNGLNSVAGLSSCLGSTLAAQAGVLGCWRFAPLVLLPGLCGAGWCGLALCSCCLLEFAVSPGFLDPG